MPGVNDKSIRLGVLSDLSNVYGPLAKTLVEGNQLYFDQRNEDGGICGRPVELVVRDHTHSVQTAVSQFNEVEPKVLGFVQMLGSPIVAALAPRIEATGAVTLPTTFSTDWLGREGLVVTGTSYPVEMVNGLSYLLDQELIAEGDTVGHLYFEGDYGSNALTGSKHFADQHGIKVKAIQLDPATTDLSAQVNELREAKVSAIALSAGPRQTASVAGLASAAGLDVPLVANGPGFDPALLDTPVGDALVRHLIVASPQEPFAGESSTAQQIADAYAETYPDATPTAWVNYGYAAANLMGQALDAACEAEDLTREGVLSALRSFDAADTGVMPVQDLTDPLTMPSTQSFISKVDRGAAGGLTVLDGAYTSSAGDSYSSE